MGIPNNSSIQRARNQEGSNPALDASPKLPPIASVARDGRAMVIYNGFAASRIKGVWSAKVEFSADDLEDEFFRTSEASARELLIEAIRALPRPWSPSFRRGTLFFDVVGVPVSVSMNSARAWEFGSSRRFPLETVLRHGRRISEARFRAAVARPSSQRTASH